MSKPPDNRWGWRQNTPADQLVVLAQSLWGHSNNALDAYDDDHGYGELDIAKLINRMSEHSDQLLELIPYIKKGSW